MKKVLATVGIAVALPVFVLAVVVTTPLGVKWL